MAVRNGWHKVGAFEILVEKGVVVAAAKFDSDGCPLPAHLYRRCYSKRNRRIPEAIGWEKVEWGHEFHSVSNSIYRGVYHVW